MAQIISIKTDRQRALDEGVAALSRGEAIAIPTETVYGLAADATDPAAIARIYETKGRPRFNPLICHMADFAMARHYGVFDPLSAKLAEAFWPGPLTLIVPLVQNSAIHDLATAGLESVGIRVPEGFAADLIAAFGRPLAAPSANTSGKISPTSAAHVADDLGDKISLIIDGGPSNVGVESTIIKIEGETIRLLRPGGLDVARIEACLGRPVERLENAQNAAIEAPGMLASHYAPHAPVRLNVAEVEAGDVLVNFGGQTIAGSERAVAIFDLSPGGNLTEAAANLFATMKAADQIAAAAIAFAPVPDHNLGEAINDRLTRAAAPRP